MKTLNPLPIDSLREELVAAATGTRRIVLGAPTGSGKSTRVPPMLLDGGVIAPDKKIIVLQPRRLAARMLACRVAEERGCAPGGEVGFHIRFDRIAGPDTRILFVTEGILLRMMLADPDLSDVGAVVFDEFHERHLYSDLGIAMVRELQKTRRPDLVMVVMSATLDTEALTAYLAPCALLKTEGRTYPITVEYSAAASKVADAPLWETAAYHLARLAKEHPAGDALIFMPGAYEIRRTVDCLRQHPALRDWLVFPLYGELTPKEQDAAVARYGQRKAVVATNVAETSITIDGITLVVDSGLARIARFDPHRGINTLLVEKISQAAAEQRAGRAGRTAPGHCLRLWGAKEHSHLPVREMPEVHRIDLAETVLALKLHKVGDPALFPWFEAPAPKALARAQTLLHDLGALHAGNLTPMGRRMAQFPVHPRYARMLLAAGELGCTRAVCLIAALTQVRRILLPLQDARLREERDNLLGDTSSDFILAARAWRVARDQGYDHAFCRRLGIHAEAARQTGRLTEQFLNLARSQKISIGDTDPDESSTLRCILIGFSDQLAKRDNRATLRCSLIHNRRGELRRESAAREAPLLVAAEIDEIETRGEVTVLLSMASAVEEAWLEELFPDDLSESSEAVWDPGQKRVVARRQRRFRDLVLEERESGQPNPDQAAAILTQAVLEGRAELKRWNDQVEAWITRVNFAARHIPELGIAGIDEAGRHLIIEQLCHGAVSARDLREADPWPILRTWLTHEQAAALEQYCPETFKLPTRSRPLTIRYEPESGRALIASRLQDFYDVDPAKLTLGGGRLPLTIELLAPNGRPCQVTGDLAAFWKTSYEGVKKELKGRYPKHEWR